MHEIVIICDASPLILLSKVGYLQLIKELSNEVWIPETVWNEVVNTEPDRPEVAAIRAMFESNVCQADKALESAYRLQVDAGEASALALIAKNPQACLLMDDARGRKVAAINGFRCIGTLGVLVRARKAGKIPALGSIFEELKSKGFYIDEKLIIKALKSAGE
jgi:hypothetical protein